MTISVLICLLIHLIVTNTYWSLIQSHFWYFIHPNNTNTRIRTTSQCPTALETRECSLQGFIQICDVNTSSMLGCCSVCEAGCSSSLSCRYRLADVWPITNTVPYDPAFAIRRLPISFCLFAALSFLLVAGRDCRFVAVFGPVVARRRLASRAEETLLRKTMLKMTQTRTTMTQTASRFTMSRR